MRWRPYGGPCAVPASSQREENKRIMQADSPLCERRRRASEMPVNGKYRINRGNDKLTAIWCDKRTPA